MERFLVATISEVRLNQIAFDWPVHDVNNLVTLDRSGLIDE